MKLILWCIFLLSAGSIIWAMIGYPISLKLLTRLIRPLPPKKTNEKPSVTVMIVAHNEESVIAQKLENVIDNDYPKDKICYLIASDNSTDHTNELVKSFIEHHSELPIELYTTKEHKGKTNAQNEAQKLVTTDLLVMTDANSMFKRNAISELVSSFSDENIKYVCGALLYSNTANTTAQSESNYWNGELRTRSLESNLKTITAGNGAIYACRNQEYIDVPPIECHDSAMPYYYGAHHKRAIFNERAIAYEKAGETSEDEYKRKVRMNRVILKHIKNGLKVLNVFKYGWFSYFYFGHRTTRYLLWLNHLLVLLSSIGLAYLHSISWTIVGIQVAFYLVALIGKKCNNRIAHAAYYYCMTILAQWNGVFRVITGKAKPTWEKAESTR